MKMGDWEALAEIYLEGQLQLQSQSSSKEEPLPLQDKLSNSTYCLCSRVFIKNYYDVYASTLEKDEYVSETEDTTTAAVITNTEESQLPTLLLLEDNTKAPAPPVHFSVVSAAELLIESTNCAQAPAGLAHASTVKQRQDNDDANSCYYSASASHTDNYYSTDEHEHHHHHHPYHHNHQKQKHFAKPTATDTKSTAPMERLQSSDSGADISENHLLDKMRWPADDHHPHHINTVATSTLIEGSAEDDEEVMVSLTHKEVVKMSPSPVIVHHERNNSLPNVLCPDELATEWETYWNRHGEQLIWASWIEKYSDYLDPAFKEGLTATNASELNLDQVGDENNVNQVGYSKQTSEKQSTLDHFDESYCDTANTLNETNIFTFDEDIEEERPAPLLLVLPPTEIVVSNCSPGTCDRHRLQSQMVPTTEEDPSTGAPWSTYRTNRLSVDERLLSPRCESVNSSIPYTVGGATDSMTNVTRMTYSSCEFCSSKVTSESSEQNINNDSSMSATEDDSSGDGDTHQVTTTHSSQFYEAIDNHRMGSGKLDPGVSRKKMADEKQKPTLIESNLNSETIINELDEDAMDVDQYWQVLWEKHFQEQYARHYKEFTVEQRERMEDRVNMMSGSLKSEAIFDECVNNSYNNYPHHHHDGNNSQVHSRRSRSVKRLRKSANECLPKLVANLKIKNNNAGQEVDANWHLPTDGASGAGPDKIAVDTANETETTEQKETQKDSQGNENCEKTNDDVSNLMASYGLPTAFGSTKQKSKKNGSDDDEDKDKPPKRATTLKRSHESDSEEVNRDRIKDAFQLMGFAYENVAKASEDDQLGVNLNGEVVYRKKHIRLHNRALKMKTHSSQTAKPKLHIRFDEEGNAIGAEEESVDVAMDGTDVITPPDPVLLHSSSDDESGNGTTAHHQRAGGMATSQAAASTPLGSWVANQQTSVEPVAEISEDEMQVNNNKKKKRKRKGKITALLPPEIANDKTLMKYWYKRFSLFQMFDLGIKMDRESWFSVTPEKVAAHAAERCRCDLIVDGFCGVGGNAIQFAMTCSKVIAIDIDPKKIEMAKHNAGIYGVADRIEFIVGDFFQLAESLKADVVFLSPPWGGPQYLKVDTYDLEEHLQPVAASVMMEKARQIASNIAIFIPRNSNTQQLTQLAGPGGSVEIEQSFLDRKLIALTAYYGELINE